MRYVLNKTNVSHVKKTCGKYSYRQRNTRVIKTIIHSLLSYNGRTRDMIPHDTIFFPILLIANKHQTPAASPPTELTNLRLQLTGITNRGHL